MTPEPKLLSILIPTRNRLTWLELLLRQLAQEPEVCDGQVEMLVSDNASTDQTPELLERLADEFPSFALQFFVQEENLGLVGNIAWLVEAADSEYVWLLGDDDRPEPGAVAEILAALRARRPALLHLPHRFEPLPDGPTTLQSPCPETLETFPSARELLLAYTHWVSFISAVVVRRDALMAAMTAAPTDNPWAPYIWFALAGRDAECAVLPRRLLVGAGEASWRDTYQRYMTSCTIDTYDQGLGLILSPAEFATLLDERCRTGGASEAWDTAPLDELISAVRRFPCSRLLRKKLADRVARRARPDALAIVAGAVRESGDGAQADWLVATGEQRFAAGDLGAAGAAFTAAVDLAPTHVEAWCDLGVVRTAYGSYEAVFAFDTAIELDPDHVGALLNRAAWALARGHAGQAALDAERVVSLAPENQEARAILAQLDSRSPVAGP
jgi:Flp pilus assembly protein TadD